MLNVRYVSMHVCGVEEYRCLVACDPNAGQKLPAILPASQPASQTACVQPVYNYCWPVGILFSSFLLHGTSGGCGSRYVCRSTWGFGGFGVAPQLYMAPVPRSCCPGVSHVVGLLVFVVHALLLLSCKGRA